MVDDLDTGVPVNEGFFLRHKQRIANHNFLTSVFKTIKKTNRKNPWNEFIKTKSNCNEKDASGLSLAPENVNNDKIQESPRRIIIPERESINLRTSFGGRIALDSW